MSVEHAFTRAANGVAHAAGKPVTFALCCAVVVAWAAMGPIAGFSDTWQLIINTGTTIVTFLMVFLIQNTQNRDGAAIQAKLDELIRTSAAQNYFVGIEHLTEQELEDIRKRCEERAKAAGGGPEPPLGADAPAEAKAEEALDTAARRARRAADELT